MRTQELIDREVANLPEPLQGEVYDFMRFLRSRARSNVAGNRQCSALKTVVPSKRREVKAKMRPMFA